MPSTTPTMPGTSMPAAPAYQSASNGPAADRYDPAVLDAMACDIGARPEQAPHFDDVASALRAVRREPGALIADFDLSAAVLLEEIVAAERLCCASIGWHVERLTGPNHANDGVIRLRMEGETDQLDALALLFTPSTANPPSGSV